MLTVELISPTGDRTPARVQGGRCLIGKDNECHVVLSGWRVSRRHAEVFVSNDRLFVRDLESTFGTLVNETRVQEAHPVGHEDTIRIGNHALRAVWRKADGGAVPVEIGRAHV